VNSSTELAEVLGPTGSFGGDALRRVLARNKPKVIQIFRDLIPMRGCGHLSEKRHSIQNVSAFDTGPGGGGRFHPYFAHCHRIPGAPARCAPDLVPFTVDRSEMGRSPACGDALRAEEEKISLGKSATSLIFYPRNSNRIGASTHSFTRTRNVTASLPSTTR
jgi:hypothetical protein